MTDLTLPAKLPVDLHTPGYVGSAIISITIACLEILASMRYTIYELRQIISCQSRQFERQGQIDLDRHVGIYRLLGVGLRVFVIIRVCFCLLYLREDIFFLLACLAAVQGERRETTRTNTLFLDTDSSWLHGARTPSPAMVVSSASTEG